MTITWDWLIDNGYMKQTAITVCQKAAVPGVWRIYDRKEHLLAETAEETRMLEFLKGVSHDSDA